MIQMNAEENTVEAEAPVLETMEDIAEATDVEEIELTGAAATLDEIVTELEEIVGKLVDMKAIVGKAEFKKASVNIRKQIRPIPDRVMQVWRDIYTEANEALESVPSARKQKTPEDIQAEIDKLQARLAAAQA